VNAVVQPQPSFGRPEPGAVRAELARILSSPEFHSSDRLTHFLSFVVEHTLAGEGGQLKEYRLGVEVFGRPASYDPRLDPVVRLEARRLRARLERYYQNGGLTDPMRIEVPKGGYAASFIENPRRAATATFPAAAMPETGSRPFSRPLWLVIALLVIAAASVTIYEWSVHRNASAPATSSIAVLPFLNLTGDPGLDYLSDGFTEQLTGSLSSVPALKVVGRTSAWQFRDKADDIRVIGRRLNVAYVLEGSVQRAGGQLNVTAQLIRTSDGFHVWSNSYQRDRDQLAVTENDVRNAIAARLVAAAGHDRVSTAAPEAYELYLRAQYLAIRSSSLADAEREISVLNQAIDRDPLFADAYAMLAGAYAQEGINSWAPADKVFPAARAAAQRALELDPDQSRAHAVLAEVAEFFDWDFARAERELKRAAELNPNSAAVHQWYGILLTDLRRFPEAEEHLKLARALNPLVPLPNDMSLAILYANERQYDRSIAVVRQALSEHEHVFPHMMLALLYACKGQYPEALQEAQKAKALSPNDPEMDLTLAMVYARSGQPDRARAILAGLTSGSTRFVPAFSVAAVYAVLGEKDQMYSWLDKAVAQRSAACLGLNVSEYFDRYRSEPRFQKLLQTIGFTK
jgi:TolB-like protein/Tfp pilus assembly protein PilF